MPAGDQGIIATRAYDVFSGHTPLVGQYSLTSTVTGHLTYSPGPLLYWLIALPARFGSPHGIALVVGLANAVAVVASVALARRRGGVGLMVASAFAIALMCRSFMPEALHDNWNPSAGLLPLTLLAFLCWSLACGERRTLPAVALVASFTAQCQVAFLAPTVVLVVVGLIGVAVARREGEREGRLWPWMLAALAVLSACWAPPVIDELEHDPGNLTLLYRAATHHGTTMGMSAGVHALVRAVGVPARWLRLPGDAFDSRLIDAVTAPGTLAAVSCAILLAALAGLGLLAVRRRRRDVAWAAIAGLLLAAAFVSVAASTPLAHRKVLGYTLWWGSLAGMWIWLTLAWGWLALLGSAARLRLRRRLRGRVHVRGPSRGVMRMLACATLAAVALAVSLSQAGDAHRAEYGTIATIAGQLDRSDLPRQGTVLLRSSLTGAASPLSQAIKFLLRRRGLRVLQQGAIARLGPWYELDHHRYNEVVYAYDGERAPDPAATVLARARLVKAGQRARDSITVTVLGGREPYVSRTIVRPRRGGRGRSNTQTVK